MKNEIVQDQFPTTMELHKLKLLVGEKYPPYYLKVFILPSFYF